MDRDGIPGNQPHAASEKAKAEEEGKTLQKVAELEKKIEDLIGKIGIVILENKETDTKLAKTEKALFSIRETIDEITKSGGRPAAEGSDKLAAMVAACGERVEKLEAELLSKTLKSNNEEIKILHQTIGAVTEEIEDIRSVILDLAAKPPERGSEKLKQDKISEHLAESVRAIHERVERDMKDIQPVLGKLKQVVESGSLQNPQKLKELETRLAKMQEADQNFSKNIEAIITELSSKYQKMAAQQDQLQKQLENELEKHVKQQLQTEMGNIDELIKSIEISAEAAEELSQQFSQLWAEHEKQASAVTKVLETESRTVERIEAAQKMLEEVEGKVAGLVAPLEGAVEGLNSFVSIDEATNPGFKLDDLLQVMLKHQASDLHLKEGAPPTVRLEGDLVPVGAETLTAEHCRSLILTDLKREKRIQLYEKKELEWIYKNADGTFKVSAFMQNGTVNAAYKILKKDIPTIESGNLPASMKTALSSVKGGMILVSGAAGSGKTTTLTAMLDYLNSNKKLNIITVEDNIEYLHADKLSLVSQREIGKDTYSYPEALKSALRHDPNVIILSEIRETETAMTAALAAEAGYLVIAALPTTGAAATIQRLINMFSESCQQQFRASLASCLKAVYSLKLLTRADGDGKIPAVECLTLTPAVSSLILENKVGEILQIVGNGRTEETRSFAVAMAELAEAGLISKTDSMFESVSSETFPSASRQEDGPVQEDSLMSWL